MRKQRYKKENIGKGKKVGFFESTSRHCRICMNEKRQETASGISCRSDRWLQIWKGVHREAFGSSGKGE